MKLSDNVDIEISIMDKENGKVDVGLKKVTVTCPQCNADVSKVVESIKDVNTGHTIRLMYRCIDCPTETKVTVRDIYDVLTAEVEKRKGMQT